MNGALPDTLCPECHGDYDLLSANVTRLRKRCKECGHEWSETPTPRPQPPLHDGQWVRPVSTPATEDSTFRLRTVDGDVVLVTAREFFEDNAADAELRAAILALAVGECFRDGGGAAPEWSIERVS